MKLLNTMKKDLRNQENYKKVNTSECYINKLGFAKIHLSYTGGTESR